MMKRTDLQIALLNANVRAFLKAIRLGEGTSDDAGYTRIVGGGIFTSFDRHPNVKVFLPRFNVNSTAAGAYQIIHPTCVSLSAQYGFTDFSPATQDEMAVALIAEKGALHDIEGGALREAVAKCCATWASLPGSAAGQRTEAYAAVEKAYQDAGGRIDIA